MGKFKTISGIHDPEGCVTEYTTTEYFLRYNGNDTKVRTKKYGRSIAFTEV